MQILVERSPSPMKLDVMYVEDWETWEKDVSKFPWSYDQTETCYIIAGEAVITPDDGEPVIIAEGDLVTFLAGLTCTWEIRKPIRKYYKIG